MKNEINKALSIRGKTREQKDIIKYFTTSSGMSNSAFDDVLDRKVERIASKLNERALEAHGMDAEEVKEISPIKIEDFYPNSKFFRIFSDRSYRASEYQMSYLMFSDKQMYAYSYIFDMTSEDTTEHTKEYFYEDITNIEVVKKEIDLPNPRHWGYIVGGIVAIIWGLMLFGDNIGYSGNSIFVVLGLAFFIFGIILLAFLGYTRNVVHSLSLKLTVPNNEFVCAMLPGDMPAIQGMKAKIREKKK